jgi:hypothetical protein
MAGIRFGMKMDIFSDGSSAMAGTLSARVLGKRERTLR